MNKTILFISDITNSFFLNSIITSLEKNGFDCDLVDFDANNIQSVRKDISSYFLFIGVGTATRSEVALGYINNICNEKKKKIFLLGNLEDLKEVINVIDPTIVWKAFQRPVNAGAVSDFIITEYETMASNDIRKSILLVDDSGTVLHTMKQWLEPSYKVTMVNSASNALVYLGKHKPDLILLDYEMPICDGPQMLQMLRADQNLSNIPVMFLTGRGDRESIEAVLALNPQGYLLKSLPKEKILEALADFFR